MHNALFGFFRFTDKHLHFQEMKNQQISDLPEPGGCEGGALQSFCLLLAGLIDGLNLLLRDCQRLQNAQQTHMEDAALLRWRTCMQIP